MTDEDYTYYHTGYEVLIRSDGRLFAKQGVGVDTLLSNWRETLTAVAAETALHSENSIGELKDLEGAFDLTIKSTSTLDQFDANPHVFSEFETNKQRMNGDYYVCPVEGCNTVTNKEATSVFNHFQRIAGKDGMRFLMRYISYLGREDTEEPEPQLDDDKPEYPFEHWALLKPQLRQVAKYCIRVCFDQPENESDEQQTIGKTFILIEACKHVAPPLSPSNIDHLFMIRGILNVNGFYNLLRNGWEKYKPMTEEGVVRRRNGGDMDGFLADHIRKRGISELVDSRFYCKGLFIQKCGIEPRFVQPPQEFIQLSRRQRRSRYAELEATVTLPPAQPIEEVHEDESVYEMTSADVADAVPIPEQESQSVVQEEEQDDEMDGGGESAAGNEAEFGTEEAEGVVATDERLNDDYESGPESTDTSVDTQTNSESLISDQEPLQPSSQKSVIDFRNKRKPEEERKQSYTRRKRTRSE